MTAPKLTEAQRRVLERAASQHRWPRGYVCPTPGLRGASQEAVLRALRKRGFITTDDVPTITDAGRAALKDTVFQVAK